MPGEAYFEVLREVRDLAGRREAADMRDMVAEVVDLPRLNQRLPLVRIVPQLTDGHRRGALLAHQCVVTGFLGGEQVLAEKKPELLKVLGELQTADRIHDRMGVQPQPYVRGHFLPEGAEGIQDLADFLVAVEGAGPV